MFRMNFKNISYLATTLIFLAVIFLPATASIFSFAPTSGVSEVKKLTLPELKPNLESLEAYFQTLRQGYLEKNFGFRGLLIRWYNYLSMSLFSSSFFSSPVVMGQDGWLFLARDGGRDILGDFATSQLLPQELVNKVRDEFAARRAWLASQGIRYLVVVAPNKNTVFPEFLPEQYRPKDGKSLHLDQLLQSLAKEPGLELLDLRPQVMATKGLGGKQPYYVTDTHWNILGSFEGYRAVMDKIRLELPKARELSLADFKLESIAGIPGDLAFMLGLEEHLTETRFFLVPLTPSRAKIVKLIAQDTVEEVPRSYFFQRDPRSGPAIKILGEESRYLLSPMLSQVDDPNLPKAVFFHDSFMVDLIPFFAEGFSRAYFGMPKPPRINQVRFFDREVVEREKPDIVVEEFTERYVVPVLVREAQAPKSAKNS